MKVDLVPTSLLNKGPSSCQAAVDTKAGRETAGGVVLLPCRLRLLINNRDS